MGIGKRIKEARLMNNMTQEELALRLGVTKSAVANYENETSHPKELVLYKLFSVLSVDANYLYQDIDGMTPSSMVLSSDEQKLLDSYRMLDGYQRETISLLMERELAYITSHSSASFGAALQGAASQGAASHGAVLYTAPLAKPFDVLDTPLTSNTATADADVIHIYPYLHNIASAGTGSYNDDIPVETIAAAYIPEADFIVGVNGDSMEPMFHNGDLIYIQKSDRLNIGDIGIFSKDDSIYIKKVGADRLISVNPLFPDIYPEEGNIRTIGKVLRKVDR